MEIKLFRQYRSGFCPVVRVERDVYFGPQAPRVRVTKIGRTACIWLGRNGDRSRVQVYACLRMS